MRIVLQQVSSGLYVREKDSLTRDKARARHFAGTTEAVYYCVDHQIYDCELVMLCDSPGLEIRLGPVKAAAPE